MLKVSENTLKRLSKTLNVGRWPQRKLTCLVGLMAEVDQDADLSPSRRQARAKMAVWEGVLASAMYAQCLGLSGQRGA